MEIFIVIVFILIILGIAQAAITGSNKRAMSQSIKVMADFNVTKEIIGNDGLTGIAYDEKQKKICLVKRNGNRLTHNILLYKDILSSEILEDGDAITKTSRGSQIGGALIGGLALGPIGLLLGGLTGKRKSIDKVRRLDIQIIINNSSDPRFLINLQNCETKKNSSIYKANIDRARQWQAIIAVLIKQADTEDGMTGSNKINNKFSVSEEIKNFSELRDCGILTELEFQEQKRKLLNNE